MDGHGDKKLHVGRFVYAIDEDTDRDIATIVAEIQAALREKTLVVVPVLDEKRNQMTLYLNGSQVDALIIDLGEGPPKPGELSP